MANEVIFCVEDDPHIVELIRYNLNSSGFQVRTFSSGEELFSSIGETKPDLFLLDLMLPGMDGIEICKRLRLAERTRTVPIIMLTAKSEEFDKVLGLEIGADDYITKPFSIRELIARIKSCLRRSSFNDLPEQEVNLLKYACLELDPVRHSVSKNGEFLELSLKEFELLKLLIQNVGKVLTRDLLLEKIWGYDYFGETRTVDVHIHYLRLKIEEDETNPKYIETVRGVGYRLKEIK